MECFFTDPTKVKVRNGLERSRREVGDVQALANSIKEKRQILPIVVTRNFELIDGGRRLAACILAQKQVKCVYEDVVDDAELKELEIEANCFRKDFTPAERAEAVETYHSLKQTRNGVAQSGSLNSGWTLQQTADSLGMSKANVIKQLQIHEMIQAFPELKKAKKLSDVVKAAKGLNRLADAVVGASNYEQVIKQNKKTFDIFCCDALEHMLSVPDKSINLLLTDPLYGIDADKTAINLGGNTGGSLTSSGYTISDSSKDPFFLYRAIAEQSFRFCTEDAHGYVFIGPEHYHTVRDIFIVAGWRVNIKPIIWIKREVGQCNVPTAWPASCYEMLLYVRKDASVLVKQGMPDWLECPPVLSSTKTHPFEKPVPVWSNLISRSAIPGQRMYDPCMGSGSSVEAAIRNKLFATGIDIDQAAYLSAQARLAKVLIDFSGNGGA